MKAQFSTRIILTLGLLFVMMNPLNAQIFKKITKRAEQAVNRTIERKVAEKAEKETAKAMDSVLEMNSKKKRRRKKRRREKSSEQEQVYADDEMDYESGTDISDGITSFASYSKFDFIPGETILGFEDFSQDEIGDLPARWNTNTSAEIVTLSNQDGKWMRIGLGRGAFVPEFISEIPENFTLEFDVIFDYDPPKWAYSRSIGFILSDLEDPNYSLDRDQVGKNFYRMNLVSHDGAKYLKRTPNPQQGSDARFPLEQLSKKSTHRGIPIHVSIWRQKTRVRVYVDEKKVFDVPRALEKGVVAKTLRLQSHVSEENEYFYISNIRYAVGKPDMRSKLLTEGKLVTYGITFDSGSAYLKPESHGTLKKIAGILNENPQISVEIVGHTDADGDANFNLDLSMMRASAVEQALIEQFGVAANQLSSNGKGETELLDDSNSPESKAKNRRVEFIKL